jgi:hypothetical protein
MSDTPRTDALIEAHFTNSDLLGRMADLCRELERELAELKNTEATREAKT